jgi:hypothetical protein
MLQLTGNTSRRAEVLIRGALRWALFAGLCLASICGNWALNASLIRHSKSFCPESWWHKVWAWHCAFPPVSIAINTLFYVGLILLLLLAICVTAPRAKIQLVSALLAAGMLIPVAHIGLVKFSWIATFSLLAVSSITLMFFLGARVALASPGLRDAYVH